MFEIPGAKRVRRSELFGSNSSSDDEADNVASRKDQSGQNLSKTKSKTSHSHTSSKGPGVARTPTKDEVDTEVKQPTIDYGFEYEFVDKLAQTQAAHTSNPQTSQDAHATKNTQQSTTDTADQSQSFEFNLFAPKVKAKALLKPASSVNPDSSTSPSSTKPKPASTSTSVSTVPTPNPSPGKKIIIIRNNSPTPDPTGSTSPTSKKYSILQPRPQSHYFTASQPESTRTRQQRQYSIAAIPPTQLTELSTSPWPGTHLPWRVIHIHTPGNKARVPRAAKANTKRGRPSKKRRIQMRKRVEARRAVVEQGVVTAEAEREKRTRRNREKKVKKKLREKAKKAEARLEGGADHAGEEGR